MLVWTIVRWPVMVAITGMVITLLYYVTPNVRQPRFRWLSPGAVLATVVWLAASALFGLYAANFSNFDATYGSLAGAIVFLVWLWLTNAAVLLGAELNAEIERARELQAGVVAERYVQLPARDTRGSRKRRRNGNRTSPPAARSASSMTRLMTRPIIRNDARTAAFASCRHAGSCCLVLWLLEDLDRLEAMAAAAQPSEFTISAERACRQSQA